MTSSNVIPHRPSAAGELEACVRRSLRRVIAREVGAVLLVVIGICAFVLVLTGAGLAVIAAAVIGMIAAGAALALLVAGPFVREFTRLVTQPMDLLLTQARLDPAAMNWRSGRALTLREVESDLDRLCLAVRRLERDRHGVRAELDAAREQMQQKNLAQSEFLAGMSHELRTPLNAILGYAMLLQEDAADAGNLSAAADLERIQIAGRTLLTVINDILEVAKLNTKKVDLDRSPFEVRTFADAIAEACPIDQRNGNDFHVLVSNELGIMVGDRVKLRQCVLNLLTNAFKFTRNGAVTLSVEPASLNGAPAVCFAVTDDGIGIEEAHLEDLFEAFNQVARRGSGRQGGAGLGLAITQRLAHAMGGECLVDSRPGKGSTFRLVLPLSPREEAKEVADAKGPTMRPLPVRRSEQCALVIDDDEAAIDLMQRWLERMGYDVYSAMDGEAGLAIFREHKPALVLLDALMPGRSGYEILEEMRADPELGSTPVILITVDDDRSRGLVAGASDYLRKPVTEKQLRSVTQVYRGKVAGDILVIDDDDDSAELIKRSVEPAGFSIRRASDGLQGIEMASHARPAAIVLDLAMPGLDGFGVIERLSVSEELAGVPLLVLSGHEISLAQHRVLAAAGHRFFTKGMSTPREIAASLREMVA